MIYATQDIVAVHIDGGITTVARSGNDTQKWRKLKKGEDIGEAPKPKEPQGEAVGEFVRMGKRFGFTGEGIESYVNQVLDSWRHDTYLINQFSDALKNDPTLYNRINNAQDGKYYRQLEYVCFELIDWLVKKKNLSFEDMMTYSFSKYPIAKNREWHRYYKNWRYVKNVTGTHPITNISLGSRTAIAGVEYNSAINSTSMAGLWAKGFAIVKGIENISNPKQWLPIVGQAAWKVWWEGGKIYVHLDELVDFKALYDRTSPFFNKGTITEIRYLADNNLIKMGTVEFRLNNIPLDQAKLNELMNAIDKYQKGGFGNYKGAFNIKFVR